MERFTAKFLVYSLVAVMAVFIVVLYLSAPTPPTAAAFTGPGCASTPDWGNWDISGGTCTCESETRTLNGNLDITANGIFIMRNCTLKFNLSSTGQYRVYVGATEALQVLDLDNDTTTTNDRSSFSSLNTSLRYNFTADAGSTLKINHSLIQHMGNPNAEVRIETEYVEIKGTVFENGYRTRFLRANHSLIENNTFSDVDYGLYFSNSENNTITNNIFKDNANAGVYFTTCNNNTVSYNNFEDSTINSASIYLTASTYNTISHNNILRGYDGVTLASSSKYNNVSYNNITYARIGIELPSPPGLNYKNMFHANRIYNGTGGGIYIRNSDNNTINASYIVNNSFGIYLEAAENTTVEYNYVYLNRGDGIVTNTTTTNFPILSNTILNNSGWAVWSFNINPGKQSTINYNTMCFNGNTTFWYASGSNYGGNSPMFNTFCVNISRPIKGGCTNSDEVQFYVDGNPTSWDSPPASAWTNCSLSIDSVVKNFTNPTIPGAYETVTLTFNGSEVGDGEHLLSIHCDPYQNMADDEGNYSRDTQGPGTNYNGSGGECENVTLAVLWYDGTCNVSYAVLSTNETGFYQNFTNGTYGSPKAVEWNNTWSNFSWWNESMEDEYISWLAWANDSAGNWNYSTNATFTAEACAVSVVTGPAGGGGGGAAPPPSPCSVRGGNMTILPAKEDQTVSCFLKDTFKLFNVTFAVDKNTTSKIIVQEMDRPEDTPTPTVATYKYFNITAVNLTDSHLSKIVTEFIVPNDWMIGKDVVASSVSLYRWDGAKWKKQSTWLKLESANNTYFYASLASVATSTFAIAAGKSCPICPSVSDWSECIEDTETRTEWSCSEETEFECTNFTRTRRCACPEACPETSVWSECVNDTQTRSVYTCSEETGFECVSSEEARECVLAPPLLIPLPTWEDFRKAPLETQVAVVVIAIAAVGGSAAAYWYLKIREPPRPWRKIKKKPKPRLKKPHKRR